MVAATAMGSTGYSLSIGGPIVHPEIDAIGIGAINARSLSFRNLIAPLSDQLEVCVGVAEDSRNRVNLSFDGQATGHTLNPGEYASVRFLGGLTAARLPPLHTT